MMRIEQGADWGRSWPLNKPDGSAFPDFTGWAALAQVRATAADPTVLWSWSTSPGAGTITFESGAVVLSHSAADSLPWEWRLGVWDLRVADASDRTALVTGGRVMVIPVVTRD